jgi:hypothetical protein
MHHKRIYSSLESSGCWPALDAMNVTGLSNSSLFSVGQKGPSFSAVASISSAVLSNPKSSWWVSQYSVSRVTPSELYQKLY